MKITLIKMAICGVVMLSACSQQAQETEEVATQAKTPVITLIAPVDNDTTAWRAYFKQELAPYMDNRYRRPYTYFIPQGDDEESMRQYEAQLEAAENAIGRGVQIGSMLAFGGPNSQRVADLVETAFKLAGPKSMKGVRVVVLGDEVDQARVEAAIAPTEADFIFVALKH